jgi:Fur family ferric uptake transcriptional regulator
MRTTKQREVIVAELIRLHTHPSADELYSLVKMKVPRISLGTVYRNLEILSREGIIRRLELGRSQRRYDGDLHKHQHIHCVRCGRIDDLPVGGGITGRDQVIVRDTGYRILEKRVEFMGICPACRKKDSGKSRGNGRSR